MSSSYAAQSDTAPASPKEGLPPPSVRGQSEQRHYVSAPLSAGSGPPGTFDGPRIDPQVREMHRHATQDEQLLKSVDTLIRLHEREVAQRQALQSTLDRLIEEIASAKPARVPESLGDEIRKGVSEDLTPLLHAIIDLLELSMRRVPSDGTPAPEATSPAPGPEPEPNHAATTAPGPPDDLPRALPQILTKSVEELVESAGATPTNERFRGAKVSESRRPRAGTDPQDRGRRERGAPGDTRGSAWIPVTPGRTKI